MQSKLGQEGLKELGIYHFTSQEKLIRALTNKIHELEYQAKNGKGYQYGNNEELIGMGQQLLEFYFFDYMITRNYPNPATQIKKTSDIITLRQKVLSEKNLSELAVHYKLHQYIQVGNQKLLRSNQKVQAEVFKAVVAAHYYDKDFDTEFMKELLAPIIAMLLEKHQYVDLNDLKRNSKSQFYEFINNHSHYKPRITYEWHKIAKLQGGVEQEFTYQLCIDGVLDYTQKGVNKRVTEQLMFKNALKLLKQRIQSKVIQEGAIVAKGGELNDSAELSSESLLDSSKGSIFLYDASQKAAKAPKGDSLAILDDLLESLS